jgi:hypothetical protein
MPVEAEQWLKVKNEVKMNKKQQDELKVSELTKMLMEIKQNIKYVENQVAQNINYGISDFYDDITGGSTNFNEEDWIKTIDCLNIDSDGWLYLIQQLIYILTKNNRIKMNVLMCETYKNKDHFFDMGQASIFSGEDGSPLALNIKLKDDPPTEINIFFKPSGV